MKLLILKPFALLILVAIMSLVIVGSSMDILKRPVKTKNPIQDRFDCLGYVTIEGKQYYIVKDNIQLTLAARLMPEIHTYTK